MVLKLLAQPFFTVNKEEPSIGTLGTVFHLANLLLADRRQRDCTNKLSDCFRTGRNFRLRSSQFSIVSNGGPNRSWTLRRQ